MLSEVLVLRTACIFLLTAGATAASGGQDPPASVAAREGRLRQARTELAVLLKEQGVDGILIERLQGSYVFSPRRHDLPQAPIANPEEVGALAVGPLLQVWGTLDERGGLAISRYALRVRSPSAPGSDAALPGEVRSASTALRKTLEEAVKPGAMSVSTRGLDDPSPLTRDIRSNLAAIRKAYREAIEKQADDKVVTAIVREWAENRALVADAFFDSDDHKALYGPPDNYDPWRYDLIYRQSRSVVAIGEPGAFTARCSGVLIANDLVLTAGHCFGGARPKAPKELEIWFDYARVPAGNPPTIQRRAIVELLAPSVKRLPDMMAGAFDADLPDYAIVRFSGTPAQSADPQCIGRVSPLRHDPLYVVGYPRGEPIMVHDSARVYLPYRILNAEFHHLRLDVDADMLQSDDRVEFMKQFDASYETVAEVNDVTYRFFHHVKDGNQPRMGIVADTFQGNSGGPVYDRERKQCVVGILVAGAEDTGTRLTPNWKHHERVLPVSAILQDAERYVAGIRNKLRVE
jgi:hypothetical protein